MRKRHDNRRTSAVRVAAGAIVAFTLAGCAAPRYQTSYRYEPPADPTGAACVDDCAQHRDSCRDTCRAHYSACVQALEPEAKARFDDAIKRHEGALEQYRRDLDRYNLSISVGWGHYHDHWFGGGWYDPWPYGFGRPYYPPAPPQPPTYAEELRRLRAERCDRDCGCQPDYDACFTHCGGKRFPERRCIANCPPDS